MKSKALAILIVAGSFIGLLAVPIWAMYRPAKLSIQPSGIVPGRVTSVSSVRAVTRFEYEYEVDGKKYIGTTYAYFATSVRNKNSVNIRYLTDDPTITYIEELRVRECIISIIGIACILFAFIYNLLTCKKTRREVSTNPKIS
ncbi:MAG: hypothetical protein LBB82_10255 [Treponema sp.]|nr:hypothetical protein [Treponema sp.]